jgi:hypothetical protein
MLSEEALIVLAALGAWGLLVLGVLELVWPSRTRHPVRRRPLTPRAAVHSAPAAPGAVRAPAGIDTVSARREAS